LRFIIQNYQPKLPSYLFGKLRASPSPLLPTSSR